MDQIKQKIVFWLKSHLIKNNKKGYLIGISGGVDSCVLTHLLHQGNIPYLSIHYLFEKNEDPTSNEVINYLALKNELHIEIKDLRSSFHACMHDFCIEKKSSFDHNLFKAILKAKLAHIDLSEKARIRDYMVLGTINLDEFMLGYFVKNTCIGDILPFANIPKKVIRNLGKYLGIPENITNIKASGCVYGTIAEEEWGISENEVYYLVTNQYDKIDDRAKEIYDRLYQISEHKRSNIPIFKFTQDEFNK